MAKPTLRVRGSCPKCKTPVVTDAPAGRTTWRGNCTKADCDGRVIARRIKDPAQLDPPPTAPAAGPTPTSGGRRPRPVVKVASYERTVPQPKPTGAAAPVRPAAEPAGRRPGTGDQPPVEPVDGPGQPEPQQPVTRPKRARTVETGDTGRHPYGHIFGW